MIRLLWLQVALAISIAFNIGMLIYSLNRPPPGRPHTPDEFLSRISGSVSPADYNVLKAEVDRSRMDMTEKRTSSDLAMQDVTSALKANPFDEAALKNAMENARKSHCDSEEAFHRMIIEAAPKLSPQGRLALIPKTHGDTSH